MLSYFIFGSLILSLLVVFIRKMFFETIDSVSTIIKLSHISFLGVVPKIKHAVFDYMIAHSEPGSVYAEAFRHIQINMKSLAVDNHKPQVILVSSFISAEGKTFCATNIASTLAKAGKKTVLLDLDMHRPKIHDVLDIPNDMGIKNFLINIPMIVNTTTIIIKAIE